MVNTGMPVNASRSRFISSEYATPLAGEGTVRTAR